MKNSFKRGMRKSRSETENVDDLGGDGCTEVEAGHPEDGRQSGKLSFCFHLCASIQLPYGTSPRPRPLFRLFLSLSSFSTFV